MTPPRFYPILDTGVALKNDVDPVNAAEQILDAGAKVLQFRHKAFLSLEAFGWLERIAELARSAGATLVINDRADLAKLFGAALHLGQDDLPPTAARLVIGSDGLLGFSTHNEAQLRAAAEEPADYLALGPLFGTVSKENPDATVGLDEFRRLRPLSKLPLVAIGGITRANALPALEAGADSLAIIGDLFPDDGNIRARSQEWLQILPS